MHGLNIISTINPKNSECWCAYQKQQLQSLNEPDLRIAFPGSLLCNHLLLPVEERLVAESSGFVLPDVADVVYRYCSGTESNPLLDGALVLDAGGVCDTELVATCIARQVDITNATKIVVLGQSAHGVYSDAINRLCGDKVKISILEPDWMSAFALHSIYRQASSLLFVDTMRALDAACTGCVSSMIVGKQVRYEPSFPVLEGHLKSCGWNLIDEAGHAIADAKDELAQTSTPAQCVPEPHLQQPFPAEPFLMVENNMLALQQVLKLVAFPGEYDWLSGYGSRSTQQLLESGNEAVIKPYSSGRNRLFAGLRDKKTGFSRKAAKLRDDPVAFFSDSNNKVIRLFGRIAKKKL